MKFKRIMLVTFVLLAILTIGAVSASDDIGSNETLAVDDGNSIESDVNDVDLLSNGDSEDDEGDDEGILYR